MWSVGVVTIVVTGVKNIVEFGVTMDLVKQPHNVVTQLVSQRRVLRLQSNVETETK